MMRLKTIFLFVILIAALLLTIAAVNGQTNGDNADIDAFIQERMDGLDIPGAALAFVRGEELVHLKGYGVANADGDPVTPQTPFLLASFSKSMTATAVMQLVEAGEMELDAPIQQYLPWFIPGTPITNYDVMRLLIETVSGQPYGEYMQANLFVPLAMGQSFTSLEEARANGMSSPVLVSAPTVAKSSTAITGV